MYNSQQVLPLVCPFDRSRQLMLQSCGHSTKCWQLNWLNPCTRVSTSRLSQQWLLNSSMNVHAHTPHRLTLHTSTHSPHRHTLHTGSHFTQAHTLHTGTHSTQAHTPHRHTLHAGTHSPQAHTPYRHTLHRHTLHTGTHSTQAHA